MTLNPNPTLGTPADTMYASPMVSTLYTSNDSILSSNPLQREFLSCLLFKCSNIVHYALFFSFTPVEKIKHVDNLHRWTHGRYFSELDNVTEVDCDTVVVFRLNLASPHQLFHDLTWKWLQYFNY